MNKQEAQQFIQWLNRISDYVPPICMREAQNLTVLKVLSSLASGEITIQVTPASLTEG